MKFSSFLVVIPALVALAQAATIPPRAERGIQVRQFRGGRNRGGRNRGGANAGNAAGNNNNGGAAASTTAAAPAATADAGNNNAGAGNNNNGGAANNNNGGAANNNNGGAANNNNGGAANNNNGGAANNNNGGAANNNNGGAGNNNNGGGNNNNGGGNNNNNGDAQASLTLDPGVIQAALQNDGQENGAEDGQVASLTSDNNFINFCLTTGQPLTDGKQIAGGSCNPTTIGQIPSTNNLPSVKFVNPPNTGEVQADQAFTVEMNIDGINTGFFTNPDAMYYQAPIQLGNNGQVNGHTHVTIQRLNDGLQDTNTPDPNVFSFFKGVNNAANNGRLTVEVDKGLPAGVYRMCSITTGANHQMILGPKAQRGAFDDCTYFTAN